MDKRGPVYILGCDTCQDLADQIDALTIDDPELRDLGKHLRRQKTGFFKICVAEEDNILWPGGPDIRDIQFGGRESISTVITPEGTFSNQPL